MRSVKKVSPFFTDTRGTMTHLLNKKTPITSALLITSKKGSTRAGHYHKKDTHYVYLLSGKLAYSYKSLTAKSAKKRTVVVNKGYSITTPPETIHAVKFLEDSEFLVLTTEARGRKQYEKDTVRVAIF